MSVEQAGEFQRRLASRLEEGVRSHFRNNLDLWRFSQTPRERFIEFMKDSFLAAAAKLRRFPASPTWKADVADRLSTVLQQRERFEALFAQLSDEESRQLLVDVIAFRILGRRRIKLPTNNADYWQKRSRVDDLAVSQESEGRRVFELFDAGQTIKIDCHPSLILNTFLLEQYGIHAPWNSRLFEKNANVVDVGACFGDTSLYFAQHLSAEGRVFAFEIDPQNTSVLKANLDNNPSLGSKIELAEVALWSESGRSIAFTSSGPGTSLSPNRSPDTTSSITSTVTLDDYVARHSIPRVDCIKMDIEGSEQAALKGAEETLQTWAPNLAISIYHSLEDILSIPEYLRRVRPSYRLYLRHYSIHDEETILLAHDPSAEGLKG